MRFERAGNLFLPKNIIRGGRTIEALIEPPTMRMEGFFTVELIDAKTQRVKRRLDFKNLITNAALDAYATSAVTSLLTYAGVGTGGTAPANTDTTLQAEIAPTTTNRTNNNGGIAAADAYTAGPPDYWERTLTYLFVETQGNGNLTEIGLFSATSGGTMWTRQLLKDGTGTPTVITKTASDQLRVTYKLRTYPPNADVTGNILISGTNYAYTLRAANVTSGFTWQQGFLVGGPTYAKTQPATAWSGALAARTTQPTGTSSQGTVSTAAYVGGNYYMDSTYVWDTTVANFGAGGIPAITFYQAASYGPNFQCGFAPALPKDNTKKLTLIFRNSWGRYP